MASLSASSRIPLLSPPLGEQTAVATQRSGSLSRNAQRQPPLLSTTDEPTAGPSSAKSNEADVLRLEDASLVQQTTTHQHARRRSNDAHEALDDEDAEDIVAISGEDAVLREDVLQEGGYRQVGGQEVRDGLEKNKLDRAALIKRITINVLIIAAWFFFSTLMNLYNSWLFSKKRENFVYPLFTTSIHMVVQFILSCTFMFICRRNRKVVPRRRNGKRARPSAYDYMAKVMPCALATALDIGLSNLSLKTITLTFYTMCKSSNLAFVLVFAVFFGLEKLRLSLVGIIALITVGVIMMVAAETEFVLEGAVEVLTASAMGGLRWALMQMLLKRKKMGMSNPIATMFWLSPLMGAFMLSGSLVIESWRELFDSPFFKNASSGIHTIGLLIAPGFIVFCMNLCEFTLIQRTSVITLSVAGIFKEILTIFISSTVFGDELTPINVTGLCIAIVGIALYNYYKYRLMLLKSPDGKSILSGHGGDDDDDDEDYEYDSNDAENRGSDRRYTELDGGVVSTKNLDGQHNNARGLAAGANLSGQEARYAKTINNGGGGHDSLSSLAGKHTNPDDENDESESSNLLTEEERERRRKREEEADMSAWGHSGFERTGNGYDDGRDYDSDATA